MNYGCINAIALNSALIENSIEEKCILAEELGHYFCNATYSLFADKNTINKAEYKAKKWQAITLVPIKRLKELLLQNRNYIEICEELEITEEVLHNAIRIYKNKGALI